MAKANEYDPGAQPRLGDGTYTFMQRREGYVSDLMSGTNATPAYLDAVLGTVERHDALLEGGYVESTFFSAVTDPKTRAGIEENWAQWQAAAGHEIDDAGHPIMPDGYTPGGHGGHSIEGNLRTYRRKYDVDGWTVRMGGSVTACKRFSRENGRTFRLPVTIADPEGRKVSGTVLVTDGGGGNWSVTPLGMPGPKGMLVASAVQATLEAKRPTMVPRHAGGLMGRARERAAVSGADLSRPLRSTWMDSVGYQDAESMMVTRTSTGRVYGHSVPRETFEKIAMSTSPGAMFNALIKKEPSAIRQEIATCSKCSRIHSAARAHRCPVEHAAPATTSQPSNRVTRAGSLAVAAGAMAARDRMKRRLALRSAEAALQPVSADSPAPVAETA